MMNRHTRFLFSSICWIVAIGICGCDSEKSIPFNAEAFGSSKYLYVASGNCYGGGVATSAGPSQTISKYDLKSGQLIQVVADYNQIAPGDSPISIADYDENRMLVLVENTGGRRVDLVNKDGSGFSTYLINGTALNAVLRSLTILSDYSLLVSKSNSIEKFNAAKSRVTSGANPYVSAPAGACATSTTLISSMTTHSNGMIVLTHAAATPNNKISVISASGYNVAGDCLSGVAGPTTTALPTRAIFHSSGQLWVSFGSTTATSNFIYSYNFNPATGALSGATQIFNDNSTINGPSSMAEDPTTGDLYVANVTSTFNTIERLKYNGSILQKISSQPFISYNTFTRCVSDMKVLN